MTRQEILAAIPHRDPFLLVDEIVERSDSRIVGVKTFTGESGFSPATIPAIRWCRGCCFAKRRRNAGRFCSRVSSREMTAAGKVPVLTRMNDVRFKRMVRPGEKMVMEVELIERLPRLFS